MKRLLPLALLLPACAQSIDVVEGQGEFGQNSYEIFGGSAPYAPEHAATVALHQLTNNGSSVYVQPFCSGTLVAPNVILTAAHCLDVAATYASTFSTMPPSSLAIYVGDDPSVDILDHLYLASATLINPGYDRFALQNDIALVRISGTVTETSPIAPLPASLGFTSADIGSTINFAGFGQTETGSAGVKLQVDGVLGGLGCTVAGCPDAGFAASQISYAQATNGPCFGDSGGPAFLDRGGVPYVAGVTSYGDANCTQYGVSTRVDAYESFISNFVNCDYNGSVSSSVKNAYHTLGSKSTGTVLAGSLSWTTASADLDLYLEIKATNRNSWSTVASSARAQVGGTESLSYTVPSAQNGRQYRWRVNRRSGASAYCLAE